MEITREIAAKVLSTVDAGLVSGMGKPIPGQMCVEAAVCYAMGLPHGDEPTCVSPALRALKIKLNDSKWSSPAARAGGMRRLAIAQLGSADTLDDAAFIKRASDLAIHTYVPLALRAAASIHNDNAHKAALEAAAVRCEEEGTRAAASNAAYAARAAYTAASAAPETATLAGIRSHQGAQEHRARHPALPEQRRGMTRDHQI